MNEHLFPPLIGNKVVVNIPDGFPALMMKVTKELLRNPPETEDKAYLLIANYCECMLLDEHKEDNLITLVKKIDGSNAEIYLGSLERAGYTIYELNKLALIIQNGWKRYKLSPRKHSKNTTTCKEQGNVRMWTPEMVTENINEILESYGISLNSANASVIKIQRAWRKYRESILSNTSAMERTFTPFESLQEFDYEYDSDDMERVNVVKKSQNDYVPPIPDFIDDSFKYQSSMTNKKMYEDESGYEDSIN